MVAGTWKAPGRLLLLAETQTWASWARTPSPRAMPRRCLQICGGGGVGGAVRRVGCAASGSAAGALGGSLRTTQGTAPGTKMLKSWGSGISENLLRRIYIFSVCLFAGKSLPVTVLDEEFLLLFFLNGAGREFHLETELSRESPSSPCGALDWSSRANAA